jgi:hypothetical protein
LLKNFDAPREQAYKRTDVPDSHRILSICTVGAHGGIRSTTMYFLFVVRVELESPYIDNVYIDPNHRTENNVACMYDLQSSLHCT